jgi:hypothetical protein
MEAASPVGHVLFAWPGHLISHHKNREGKFRRKKRGESVDRDTNKKKNYKIYKK